jgi:hypothetical protein
LGIAEEDGGMRGMREMRKMREKINFIPPAYCLLPSAYLHPTPHTPTLMPIPDIVDS